MKVLQRICLLGLMLPTCAFAVTNSTYTPLFSKPFEPISYMPNFYVAGYPGDDLVGQGDLLIPLYLTSDNTFIFYNQGRYSPGKKEYWEDNMWTGSSGFLYRQIVNDVAVLGAYVLGDYKRLHSEHEYWLVGPGLESLGRVWDFRLNGYIPIGAKSWKNEAWANQFGNFSYIAFQEGTNNIYDHRLGYYEETGIGGDAEIGRKLFKAYNTLVKGYLQGYYYDMEHNHDVIGGGVKITVQPSRYVTFSANDTYDNYNHNTFMLGAQIRLNNLFNKSNQPIDENNLTNRLLDPIDRNYGSIRVGTTSPGYPYDLGMGLLSSNGVFFDDNGSGYISPNAALYSKGTYGNPYTEEGDLLNDPNGMQGIFNLVRSQFIGPVFMYFAPGNYYTSTAPGNALAVGIVQLPNGLNMLGREYWYVTPTYGANRALFAGTLQLMGNNSLESIMVQNGSLIPASEGILIDGTSNIDFNNVQVGSSNNNGYASRAINIINNASNVFFNNSQIYHYDHPVSGPTTMSNGMEVINSNNIILGNNNIVQVTAIGGSGANDSTAQAFAIMLDNSTLRIDNNNFITSSAQAGGAMISMPGAVTSTAVAINLVSAQGSNLNIAGNGNIFNAVTKGGIAISSNAGAYAISAYVDNVYVLTGSRLDINGNGNIFSVVSQGGYAQTGGVGGLVLAAAGAFGSNIAAEHDNNIINIAGNYNNFSVTSTGGHALSNTITSNAVSSNSKADIFYGITGNSNQFKITGMNNTLIANATAGLSETTLLSAHSWSMALAEGIDVNFDPTSVIDMGSNNYWQATANGGQAKGNFIARTDAYAHGLKFTSENVTIGSNNKMLVQANGGSSLEVTPGSGATVYARPYAYSAYGVNGNVNIGGYNNITVTANAGQTQSTGPRDESAIASGLYITATGNIYINGGYNIFGVNSISLSSLIGNATVYGIYNFQGSTNFAGSGSNIFNLNSSSNMPLSIMAYGIYTDAAATFYPNPPIVDITTLDTFLASGSYMTFNKTIGGLGTEGADYRLWWNPTFVIW